MHGLAREGQTAFLYAFHDQISWVCQRSKASLRLEADPRRNDQRAKGGQYCVTVSVLSWLELGCQGGSSSNQHPGYRQVGPAPGMDCQARLARAQSSQRFVYRRAQLVRVDGAKDIEASSVRASTQKHGWMPFRNDRDRSVLESMVAPDAISLS